MAKAVSEIIKKERREQVRRARVRRENWKRGSVLIVFKGDERVRFELKYYKILKRIVVDGEIVPIYDRDFMCDGGCNVFVDCRFGQVSMLVEGRLVKFDNWYMV